MGAKGSKSKMKRKELSLLVQDTHFNQEEVQALYDHYISIAGSFKKDGVIDKEEFVQALKLNKDSALTDRLFRLFDENDDKTINFREFITGLSVFSKKGTFEEKLKFSFRVYDVDGDGHISKDEMAEMLSASLVQSPLNLTDSQIQSLIDATFAEADTDGDGQISFEEYRAMVKAHPNIVNAMTIESPLDSADAATPQKD